MAEARGFEIAVGETDDTRAVLLRGELDIAGVPELVDALTGLSGARVVVDLSGISFIDSSGAAALVRAQQQAAADDRSLSLVRPSPSVSRVFELLGISFLLERDAD